MLQANKKRRFNPAPLAGVMAAMSVVALFNAQLITALVLAYITPASVASATTAVRTDAVDPRPRIVIPAINVDAPIVYDEPSYEEVDVQEALERGVVHFGTTPMPGQQGNSVYVGHSSNQPWAPGDYKFVFMQLEKLVAGDKIYLYKDSVRYTYEVTGSKIVKPSDVSVLASTNDATATFITCTPIGTNINRLVVTTRLIDPVRNEDDENTKEHAPELNGNLPGRGYSTIESLQKR